MCECPYCEEELEYDDYYGYLCAHQSGEVVGHIYRCPNEACESEVFNYFFHDRSGMGDDNLKEGYPC